MSAPVKNVIFVGASGNLGGPSLKQFLSLNSAFTVSALTRADSTSTYPSSVRVIKTDYSPSSLEEALKGQDVVISMLGNAGMPQQKTIIDAAIKAGVKRFLPSEFGSRTHDPKVRELVPIFNGKRQVVEYLEGQEGKISWTGFVTGPFFDWGLKVGFLGLDIKNHTAKVLDGGSVPFSGTNLKTIGHALYLLLSNPSTYKESENKYIHVASHTTTQNDIVAAAEKATGKKFETTSSSGKQRHQDGLEKLQKGDFSGIGGLISAMSWGKVADEPLGDLTKDGLWNEKLGLPKEDLEGDVKAVIEGKAP